MEVSCSSQLYPKPYIGYVNLAHQVSCSAILAAALTEFFPAARLKSFQATEKCFFCDVIFPFTFEKEALPLLEERMRAWVKKNVSFQMLEMMPANAVQFLEHHGFPTVALGAQQNVDFIKILRLDRFAGIASGKPLDATGEVKLFKLLFADEQSGTTRILGTSATSKEILKSQIEQCKKISNHLHFAEELKLISSFSGGYVWLPRGEALKNHLISQVLNFPDIDPISTPALDEPSISAFHAQYCQKTHRGAWECSKRLLEGVEGDLLDPRIGSADRISLPLNEASIISFLQIIAKFFKIFPFDARVVSVGKPAKILRDTVGHQFKKIAVERGLKTGIEFRCQDALGREWAGPRIWTEDKKGLVVLSLFNSLERFIALLLEKTQLRERVPFSIVKGDIEMLLEMLTSRLRKLES